eukprot:187420-Alexandrium_andersonii.AAC.1
MQVLHCGPTGPSSAGLWGGLGVLPRLSTWANALAAIHHSLPFQAPQCQCGGRASRPHSRELPVSQCALPA